MEDKYQITTIEDLRKIIVTCSKQEKRLIERMHDCIDKHARDFILNSPLVFFATTNNSGHVDVSPKGDAPGFIEVMDDKTLVFPERPGNTDARNLRNIIENDQVSLLFVIPRTKEVLRVAGRATITKNPVLLERMVSCGKPAVLCIKIDVSECFFHCGRAFNRSHIWKPEKWPKLEGKYLLDQVIQQRKMNKQQIEALEKGVEEFLDDAGEIDGAY
jgi:PPOX class probable FMN-dependent enzyme